LIEPDWAADVVLLIVSKVSLVPGGCDSQVAVDADRLMEAIRVVPVRKARQFVRGHGYSS
jgi:hypothetical protein